ncbi:Cof-type HAD-IIB family hydrolase [Gulosibacter faecalis]|uniref:Cof-type HAD-IIB family hydrolase n=1 Tax=Gulosibacter faecalis TaxID=272240 RepID=A0ABW5UU96_9MICO|nr:Cof-type HAD-IIB family hydrolase [Gulosibacter faecalis]
MTADWTTIDPADVDVRLVVCDMDGTLLTSGNQFPEGFDELRDLVRSRGVTFVPASGRQLATLEHMFPGLQGGSFIAENGNIVVHGGEIVSTTVISNETVERVATIVREAKEFDLGVVYCGAHGAYVERADDAFLAEASRYYKKLDVVDDMLEVGEPALKLAIFAFSGSQAAADALLGDIANDLQVVVSSANWVDIMVPGVHKGHGVRDLQEALGITPAQTVVFGDYLNDLEMMGTGDWSFAMANAHPGVRDVANYLAPSNDEFGVVQVLTYLLSSPYLLSR